LSTIICSGAPAREAHQQITMGKKTGNLSMREISGVTSVYAHPSVQTLGEGVGSHKATKGGGECHLSLAGNRAVLLGNQRFSWQEIV